MERKLSMTENKKIVLVKEVTHVTYLSSLIALLIGENT